MVFERGYIYISKDMHYTPPIDWIKVELPNGDKLSYDKLNKFSIQSNGAHWVAMVGMCMDIIDYTIDNNIICERLLNELKKSELDFWDRLDWLNGRFVLFYSIGDDIGVINDACGLRSVYYSFDGVVSSHYELVNDALGNGIDGEKSEIWNMYEHVLEEYKTMKSQTPWSLPADYTPYDGICILPCNHVLYLSGKEIKRYWPRKPKPECSLEEAIEIISETLKNEIEALTKEFKVVMSVTAGNDSRTSLAASRSVKDKITYFTYLDKHLNQKNMDSLDRYENDRYAKHVAEREGLNHLSLILDKPPSPQDAESMRINHYHHHIYPAIPEYKEHFSIDSIHVRSLLYELIRHPYFHVQIDDDVDLSELFVKWGGFNQSVYASEIKQLFSDYVEKMEYDSIYDYNPGEIFFMEYRLGQWMAGGVLLNNDLAFDTFMLLNNKHILEYGMAVTPYYKNRSATTQGIIKRLWPELLSYGIPNKNKPVFDYVDLDSSVLFNFDCDRNGRSPFVIETFSNNGESVPYVLESTFTTLTMGFSSNVIREDDTIVLTIENPVKEGVSYFYGFDILTCYNQSAGWGDVSYSISINETKIFSAFTQEFGNRINQICWCFKSKKDGTDKISISLTANKNKKEDYNGIISIKGISLRREYKNEYSTKGVLFSTLDLIKSVGTSQKNNSVLDVLSSIRK